ncbi:MAG: hypothetical protein EOP88_16005 [Verrucomicrobiaceae bacterium]|nr:MAG: hypothetical protein EOP88_16005 [Verrucomicrobiaceae bacterium]
MDSDTGHHSDTIPPPTPQKRSIWQKLGAGSLSISVLFHVVLLVIGIVWVLQVIPPPEKKVDFMPPSGGGGAPSSESKAKQHRVQMKQPDMARVAAVGATSNFTLPEPDQITQMDSMNSLTSGGLAGGLGGSGSGGGKGTGSGMGFGAGSGLGAGNGTGNKNPFGALTADRNALIGTFYDLKQTRSGEPTDLKPEDVVPILNDFVNRGWRESAFNKYFKAPQTLYQTKLYIPAMGADGAPAAFNCADKVEPSRWAIVYRGVVTPPRSGRYRFVGAGDDVLVVRFNNKTVFDHGYFSGTTAVRIHRNIPAMTGEREYAEVSKMLRRNYPMDLPLKTYKYDTTKDYNRSMGGLGVGPSFEAQAGKNYPIDILLSELPGGLFGAVLMIEEVGEKYETTPEGTPILPLFRFDNGLPPASNADNSPPYDPKGPVWKVVNERGKAEI